MPAPKIERPTRHSVTAAAPQINRSEPKAHDREDIRENTVDDTDDDKVAPCTNAALKETLATDAAERMPRIFHVVST